MPFSALQGHLSALLPSVQESGDRVSVDACPVHLSVFCVELSWALASPLQSVNNPEASAAAGRWEPWIPSQR